MIRWREPVVEVVRRSDQKVVFEGRLFDLLAAFIAGALFTILLWSVL